MCIIELIHPLKQTTLQSWNFDRAQQLISIGRSRKNDIPLASAVVSRSHAVLERDSLGWRLKPLGANGCFINEKPAEQTYLRSGQIFRVARTGPSLRFVQAGGEMSLRQQRQQQHKLGRPEDTLSDRDTFVGAGK